MAKRVWKSMREKVDAGGGMCRVCLGPNAQAAHLIARAQCRPGDDAGEAPENCVPLCDHPDRRCHSRYDRRELDLLPYVTREEAAHAVRLVGLIVALERITGCRWRPDMGENYG